MVSGITQQLIDLYSQEYNEFKCLFMEIRDQYEIEKYGGRTDWAAFRVRPYRTDVSYEIVCSVNDEIHQIEAPSEKSLIFVLDILSEYFEKYNWRAADKIKLMKESLLKYEFNLERIKSDCIFE